jgi:hypothetical protein
MTIIEYCVSATTRNTPARLARFAAVLAGGIALAGATAAPASAASPLDPLAAKLLGLQVGKPIVFPMVRSTAALNADCLGNAKARVVDVPLGPVELLNIRATGLPPNTEFDLFVIQVPNAPFGLAWYQGDLETNAQGVAHGNFVGRFNIETFIVAPGTQPAPVVHDQPPFPDANSNPQTAPVHTFHLGIWFNSPADAQRAGCPPSVTPFNGDHTAGIQALSTRNFADDQGPLRQLEP